MYPLNMNRMGMMPKQAEESISGRIKYISIFLIRILLLGNYTS